MKKPFFNPIMPLRHPQLGLRTSQGFTLVELMVVVAITAVLMAIALPDFVRATRTIQLEHQAKEMQAAIKFARSEAMRLGQTVTMCRSNATQTACNTGSPSGEWQGGWIVFKDADSNGLYEPASDGAPAAALLSIKQALPNKMQVTTSTGSQVDKYIQFNPAGETAGNLSATGQFRFTFSDAPNATNDYYLIINRTGRVRILNDAQCMLAGSGCL